MLAFLFVAFILCSQTLSFQAPGFGYRAKAIRAVSSTPGGAWELELVSPCKINLFLRILGRRPSGYRKSRSLLALLLGLLGICKYRRPGFFVSGDFLVRPHVVREAAFISRER